MFKDLKCILPCFVTNVELCASQGNVATNLRIGGKYCESFVDNLTLYSTVKEFFENQLTIDKGIAKVRQYPF